MNDLSPTRTLARKIGYRLSETRAAIDLASIMVGVLVIGIVGGVIAATVFAIIPWAQDEAAKQDLAAARSAQSVAKVQESAYLNHIGLEAHDFLPTKPSMHIASAPDGSCFIAASTSATGRIFYSTQASAVVVTEAEAEASCSVGGTLDPAAAAEIADPNLRLAMLYSSEKRPTDELTNGDVAALTELGEPKMFGDWTVDVAWMGAGFSGPPMGDVTDLSGIEGATALSSLVLRGAEVSDLRPISGLQNLTMVNVAGSPVTDLAPLSGLANLERLIIAGTQVTDLSPLSGLTALMELDLTETGVTDVRPLSGVHSLTHLYFAITATNDVVGLNALTGLTYLDLSNAPITDLRLIDKLTNLEAIMLSHTNISDFSLLHEMSSLVFLDLSGSSASAADIAAIEAALPEITVAH